MTSIPLLIHPDLNKPMVLYTDASDTCIGACLTQPCEEAEAVIRGDKRSDADLLSLP